jgi:uncharacterized protein YbjT (DUF2867 family)
VTKTVLVSGASGFIGSHVVARLAEDGYRVRAMTRHRPLVRAADPPLRDRCVIDRPMRHPRRAPGTGRSTRRWHAADPATP